MPLLFILIVILIIPLIPRKYKYIFHRKCLYSTQYLNRIRILCLELENNSGKTDTGTLHLDLRRPVERHRFHRRTSLNI